MMRLLSLITLITAIVMLWASLHFGWETDTGTTCLGCAIGAWMTWVTIEIFALTDLLAKICILIQNFVEHPDAIEGFKEALKVNRKEIEETTEKY